MYGEPGKFKPNAARLKDQLDDETPFDCLLAMVGGTIEEWMKTPSGYLKVHGGVTFSGPMKGDPDDWWWFGFDTSHKNDYTFTDLDLKRFMVRLDSLLKDPLEAEEYVKEWSAYINRVKTGEISRDIAYECKLEKRKLWSVEDVVAETEKMAEQLSLIQMLGVTKSE